MIYRLRKKFIGIVTLSFLSVFLVILISISVFTSIQTNNQLDALADVISENDGRFPDIEEFGRIDKFDKPHTIDKESPFTTRFFTVQFNEQGDTLLVDTRSVASVTPQEAEELALTVLEKNSQRGWEGDFRYKKYSTENGTAVVFVSGAGQKSSNQSFLLTSAFVFFGGSLVVLVLVFVISKWAVKPTAESYEKQKQFITDANHELKTPLTLIKTNLDIMEAENGESDWLNDIKEETNVMTELVNKLVALARMDEESTKLTIEKFDLSNAVAETVSYFDKSANKMGKKLSAELQPSVNYTGDEGAIRQLVSILLDNAVKYCDYDGEIHIKLQGGKHPIITVDNSYFCVSDVELNKLFDRFYREDKARTGGSGFGIGLSIAKAIVEKHKGSICAQNLGNGMIRFQVKL